MFGAARDEAMLTRNIVERFCHILGQIPDQELSGIYNLPRPPKNYIRLHMESIFFTCES
jgi:hypothetical protein